MLVKRCGERARMCLALLTSADADGSLLRVSRPHALNTMDTAKTAKCLSDRHVSCSSVYLRVRLWCAVSCC